MLLAGALPILSFPAANLEFLAWFGLVPGLVLVVRSSSAREGGIRAWWLGAGYLIAAMYWMTPQIGPAVLVVPSLINRYYVLDLLPERSFLHHLAQQGLRPLVVDWGEPGTAERDFTLTDYIAGPLDTAAAKARELAGAPIAIHPASKR